MHDLNYICKCVINYVNCLGGLWSIIYKKNVELLKMIDIQTTGD